MTFKVVGIREALEEAFPDDDAGIPNQRPPSPNQSFDVAFFGTSSCAVNPRILDSPAKSLVYVIMNIYLQRFDPIFKVVHAPSLRAVMLEEKQQPSDPADSPAMDALRFAVYFAAVCTLDERECQANFQGNKNNVSNRFRLATEVMLSRANLQTTKDFIVLEAFAIYLVSHVLLTIS